MVRRAPPPEEEDPVDVGDSISAIDEVPDPNDIPEVDGPNAPPTVAQPPRQSNVVPPGPRVARGGPVQKPGSQSLIPVDGLGVSQEQLAQLLAGMGIMSVI